MNNYLEEKFYLNPNVVDVAYNLLGKEIFVMSNNSFLSGIIIETEAYAGVVDKASHAYNNKYTKRTRVMYENGGIAYVYLCYGVHCLFNVVTNISGVPHAVLIRSVFLSKGFENIELKNRIKLGNGPGRVTKKLGIDLSFNGISLMGPKLFICDSQIKFKEKDVGISARIGIDYAGDDAQLPYRFYFNKNFLLKTFSYE